MKAYTKPAVEVVELEIRENIAATYIKGGYTTAADSDPTKMLTIYDLSTDPSI